MKFFSKFLTSVSLVIFAHTAFAQSALYFQGDKETGIYVKVEGQMMERQSKDFIIVPGLEAGTAHFEILFEQNKYPAQKFKIRIPENNIRGFVVSRRNDGSISLFDVQTNGYILPNNTEDDAFIPVQKREKTFYGNGAPKSSNETSELPPFIAETRPKVEDKPIEEPKKRNRFIDDLDLNQQKEREKSESRKNENRTIMDGDNLFKTQDDGVVKGKNVAPPTESENPGSLTHQNCTEPISTSQFEWYAKNVVTGDDEAKLKYLKRTYQKYCFSTEQIGMLASLLDGQATRYEFVQTAMDRTVDLDNYPVLEGLFNTDFMKKKFRDLLKK